MYVVNGTAAILPCLTLWWLAWEK